MQTPFSANASGRAERRSCAPALQGEMFHSRIRPFAPVWSGSAGPIVPGAPAVEFATARARHARLLATAAARRLRAIERRGRQRQEDAEYWLTCAPVAIAKAASIRVEGLARLP